VPRSELILRQDGKIDGMVARYSFYVSENGVNWGRAVATGTFSRDPAEKEMVFPEKQGSFVRFVAHAEGNGMPWTSMAEINVLAMQ
jgi:F5/8 type C domain